MRDFICPKCGQHLAFENSVCLSCNSRLAFSLDDMALLVIATGEESAQPGFVDGDKFQLCANLHLAECNWLVEKDPIRKRVHRVRLPGHDPTTPTRRRLPRSPMRRRPNVA